MELDNSNSEKMQKIPINERSWDSVYYGRYNTSQVTTYNEKQVKDIIKDSNIPEKRKMSRTFFSRGGFYKQVIMYYSSLLKYAGILIPSSLRIFIAIAPAATLPIVSRPELLPPPL